MEERIIKVICDINEDIQFFEGDNLFDAGLLDSFSVIELVGALEEEFDIDIDAEYVVEENFRSKDSIIRLVVSLINKLN